MTRCAGLVVAGVALLGSGSLSIPSQDDTLRVMSFNVRLGVVNDGDDSWVHRKDLLVKTVRGFGPDVLGTQEAYDFQATYLLKELNGYAHVGWPRSQDPRDGEQCAILYREDRFEKRNAGQFALSETPDVPGSMGWDAAYARIVTWVRLRDRRTDAELLFVNTHFDNRGERARLESARLLRARLRELAPEGAWIVTGDFNSPEGGPPYEALVSAPGADGNALVVVDSFRATHPVRGDDEGTLNGFSGERSGDRIDWILHSTLFEAISAEIDHTEDEGRFPSDHFPVNAVLRWRD
jgi:endonuclease/exonuclease/phosphatase family metal-dependent hydrolase